MGWETRDGNSYYYRKVRSGSKVCSVYVGGGLIAELVANQDQQRQESEAAEREERRRQNQQGAQIDEQYDDLRTVVRAVFIASGLHTHKQQWRKRRK